MNFIKWLQYSLFRSKSLFLYILLILLLSTMLYFVLHFPPAPYKYDTLFTETSKYSEQCKPPELLLRTGNNGEYFKLNKVKKEISYIDYRAKKVLTYSLADGGFEPVSEFSFADYFYAKFSSNSAINYSSHFNSPNTLLILSAEVDSTISQYVYDLDTKKRFFLYSYNKYTATVNHNGGALVNQVFKHGNYFYYGINWLDIKDTKKESGTIDRGFWRYNITTGEKENLFMTSQLFSSMSPIISNNRSQIIINFRGPSNGATFNGINDNISSIHLYDIEENKFWWEFRDYGNLYISHSALDSSKLIGDIFVEGNLPSNGKAPKWHINAETGKVTENDSMRVKFSRAEILELLEENSILNIEHYTNFFDKEYIDKTRSRYGKLLKIQHLKNKNIKLVKNGDNFFSFWINRFSNRDVLNKIIILDADAKEYARISLGELPNQNTDTEVYIKINSMKIDDILYVAGTIQHSNNLKIFLCKVTPRKNFKLILPIYQFFLLFQSNLHISISILSALIIILVLLLAYTISGSYFSIIETSQFLVHNKFFLMSEEELEKEFKPRKRESIILVVRVKNIKKILSKYTTVAKHSKKINSILNNIATQLVHADCIIDKYLADGLMVIMPIDEKNKESQILSIIDLILQVNKRYASSELQLKIGFSLGVNLIGLFGTASKKDYTAIGKGVNLAFRLAYNRADENILFGENIKKEIEHVYDVTNMGIIVKGFDEKAKFYSIKEKGEV
ncbi:MAG: hypothetical protein B6226_05295 [Candidatus Cloacimonetes bacterium 4572_65]|nr:MAG: hypothetical protein B6226_05295 [Candidatus Cloacimonetes bacterium 4572_65]